VNVAVIGLGLIGGSLVRALAAHGHRVIGYDQGAGTREEARALAKAVTAPRVADPSARPVSGSASAEGWTVADSLTEAVAEAEVAVLAVPLPALPAVLSELTGFRGLITDVTSVKVPVRDLMGDERFVGGHPMAGKETSGFLASDPSLFDGCAWVLALEPGRTALGDWLTLAALITDLGARVVPATAAEHDAAVAAVSHVPHLLAAALTSTGTASPLAAALGAGSFRDGTRVAATRPELIAAMCGGNAAAVAPALDAVLAALAELRLALDDADPVAALSSLLAPAVAARRAWPPAPGAPESLPAEVGALLDLGRRGGWVTAIAEDRQSLTALRPITDRNSL
jgi:prephenate dehydrogenase